MPRLSFLWGAPDLNYSNHVRIMTDFPSATQTDNTEKLSTERRAYIAPAITYASADDGPEGKTVLSTAEGRTGFNRSMGPS